VEVNIGMSFRFFEIGRKIVAIGRNYAAHAKEMGATVAEDPVFFLKPTSSYLLMNKGPIELPVGCDIHHELEIGVVIGKKARDVSVEKAMDHVAGYVLALDMTARNLQSIAKSKGLPWTQSKGYDTFTPIGEYIDKSKIPDPQNLNFWLKVDGELRQRGNTKDMIFPIPQLIKFVSSIMTLEIGDLILTGTPEGVSSVKHGQVLEGEIEGITKIRFVAANRLSKL